MKRSLKRLVCAAVSAALVLSMSAEAAAYSVGNYSIGTEYGSKAGSNIRTGPGTGYKKVGAASYGVEFFVDQISGDWGHTSSIYCTNGWREGWINLAYCTEKGNNYYYVDESPETSSTAQAVVDMAVSYLGYKHSTFTSWYYGSSRSVAWCSIFATYVLSQNGINVKYAYVPSLMDYAQNDEITNKPLVYHERGTYNPKPGDLLLVDANYNGVPDHVAIVTDVNGTTITTIAGNSGGSPSYSKVKYETRYTTSQKTLGYIEVLYPSDVQEEPEVPEYSDNSSFIYGDVNGDGKVSLTDIVQVNNYIADNGRTSINELAADVNLDGVIDSQDVELITKYTMGKIDSLPVQSQQVCMLYSEVWDDAVLDVYGGWSDSETPVTLCGVNYAKNQKFTIVPTGDGYFNLEASYCNKNVDINGGTGYAQIYDKHDGFNQRFKFVDAGAGKVNIVIKDFGLLWADADTGKVYAVADTAINRRSWSAQWTIKYVK